jgi:hypothetical protein
MNDANFAAEMHEMSSLRHEAIVASNVDVLVRWVKERVLKAASDGEFSVRIEDARFKESDVQARLRTALNALGLVVDYLERLSTDGIVDLSVRW